MSQSMVSCGSRCLAGAAASSALRQSLSKPRFASCAPTDRPDSRHDTTSDAWRHPPAARAATASQGRPPAPPSSFVKPPHERPTFQPAFCRHMLMHARVRAVNRHFPEVQIRRQPLECLIKSALLRPEPKRLSTVVHLPKRHCLSRHGAPVRPIHSTPPTHRLSCSPVCDLEPFPAAHDSAIRAHNASLRIQRSTRTAIFRLLASSSAPSVHTPSAAGPCVEQALDRCLAYERMPAAQIQNGPHIARLVRPAADAARAGVLRRQAYRMAAEAVSLKTACLLGAADERARLA